VQYHSTYLIAYFDHNRNPSTNDDELTALRLTVDIIIIIVPLIVSTYVFMYNITNNLHVNSNHNIISYTYL